MTEQWRPLKDHEHLYEVSDRGQVRKTLIKGSYFADGKPCAIWTAANGRNYVRLFYRGHTRNMSVARLVAETFVANPDKRKYVKHLNGLPYDDRAENLVWGSSTKSIGQRRKRGDA